MPTVYTERGFWIGGAGHIHVVLKVNINSDSGEYYVNMPEKVVEVMGCPKKVRGMGMHSVLDEAKRLCREADKKLRENEEV